MDIEHELSIEELDAEMTTDLPEREALGMISGSNSAVITAVNQALALNVGSYNSTAYASAQQSIWVNQCNR